MTFEEALAACSRLGDELSGTGIRFRITIDNGDGITAELQSTTGPRRPPR